MVLELSKPVLSPKHISKTVPIVRVPENSPSGIIIILLNTCVLESKRSVNLPEIVRFDIMSEGLKLHVVHGFCTIQAKQFRISKRGQLFKSGLSLRQG